MIRAVTLALSLPLGGFLRTFGFAQFLSPRPERLESRRSSRSRHHFSMTCNETESSQAVPSPMR
jgi:predicted phage tail protein